MVLAEDTSDNGATVNGRINKGDAIIFLEEVDGQERLYLVGEFQEQPRYRPYSAA